MSKWLAPALFVASLLPTTAHAAPRTGYIVPRTPPPPHATGVRSIGPKTIVYFRREGGKYSYGDPDSRTNTNNIHEGLLTPFECGDDKWKQVMGCLKATFLPYEVKITDVDPDQTPHIETVVAGSPSELGQPDGVGGIAPLGCDLAYDNPVAFAFTTPWGCDVSQICWAAAQETAHTLGLDHSVECSDVMTYDQSCGTMKRFIDTDKPCGEDSHLPPNNPPPNPSGPRACRCHGESVQNSHQQLLKIFGARQNAPAEVSFGKPHDGAVVTRGFAIHIDVGDDFGAPTVDILIDGVKVPPSAGSLFDAVAPDSLADGDHTLSAHVVDTGGLVSDATIHVKQQPPCVTNDDCPLAAVCQAPDCVDGPGTPGGIGATCTGDSECGSGMCSSGPNGEHRCVEACSPAQSTCPVGFDCKSTGAQGACWPGADVLDRPHESGCGCRVAGQTPREVALVGLALTALMFVLLRSYARGRPVRDGHGRRPPHA